MHRFIRNTAFSAISGLCVSVAGLLSSIVVARLLGVEGAGAVTFALWIVGLAVALCDLGVGSSLTRYLPEFSSTGQADVAQALTSALLRPFGLATLTAVTASASLAALAPSAISPSGSASGGATEWLIVAALVGCVSFGTFYMNWLRGMQQFDRMARLAMLSVALQLALVGGGTLAGGAQGALAGYVGGSIVPAALCLSIPRGCSRIDPDLRRRVRRYALYTWASTIVSLLVWSRIEVVFLRHFVGNEAVGLFSAGLTVSTLATQAPMLLTGSLISFFSEKVSMRHHDAVRDVFLLGTRLLGFMVLPMCFGTAAILPEFLPLLFGHAFDPAIPSATILVISASLGAVSAVSTNLLYASERSDFILFAGLGGAALSLVLCLALIPLFGIVGAAVSRFLVQLSMVVAGAWFVKSRLAHAIPIRHLMRLAAAALLCAVAARAIIEVWPGLPGLFVAIPASAAVYVAAVALMRALPKEDIAHLRAVLALLPVGARRPADAVLRILVLRS